MLIYKLIKELNYNEAEVWELNFINACNWLSMFKEREDRIEQEQNKNKLTT